MDATYIEMMQSTDSSLITYIESLVLLNIEYSLDYKLLLKFLLWKKRKFNFKGCDVSQYFNLDLISMFFFPLN